VRRLTDGDTAAEVLAEFLGLLDNFDFEVKALYVDSEFYDGKCLTLMQAHNHAYVVPIIKWSKAIKKSSLKAGVVKLSTTSQQNSPVTNGLSNSRL